MAPPDETTSLVLVLVGVGPRGAGLLERLVSNLVSTGADGSGPVELHLVDPFPVGGGRVWRSAQSELLRLNTTAEDLTAFVDESVVMAGPVTPGPTMYDWCRAYGVHLDDLSEQHPGEVEIVTISTGASAPDPDVILYDAIGLHEGDGADLEFFVHQTTSAVLVVSQDLRPDLASRALAKGADVLVHEAMYVPGIDQMLAKRPYVPPNLRNFLLQGHTTAEDAGRVADEAGVKTLVLSHLLPGDEPIGDAVWAAEARKHFRGEIVVGRDKMVL